MHQNPHFQLKPIKNLKNQKISIRSTIPISESEELLYFPSWLIQQQFRLLALLSLRPLQLLLDLLGVLQLLLLELPPRRLKDHGHDSQRQRHIHDHI